MTLLPYLHLHASPSGAVRNAGPEGPNRLPDQPSGPTNEAGFDGRAHTESVGRDILGYDGLQPVAESTWARPIRYAEQPMSWGTRLLGIGGVMAIGLLILGGLFLTWRTYSAAPPSPKLSVFDVASVASPPEMPPEVKEAPKPVEKKEEPVPRKVSPIERTIVPIALVWQPMPVATPKPVDPGPVEPEAAAPETQSAPPAPKVSGHAAETWEGKVLARLNRHRRYPRAAMAQRQQGVPYIRFVMDREGRVLSVTLERSSGFPELDREAVALPRRAQPLPKPPADTRRGQATIELVVPVEFILREK